MSSTTVLVLFVGTLVLCLVRAHQRGRSLLGWGLFALFLWPVALVATWFVGPKRQPAVPDPAGGRLPASPPLPAPRRAATPPAALPATPTRPASTPPAPARPVSATPPADPSIIEVGGPDVPLRFSVSVTTTRDEQLAATTRFNEENGYELPRLGKQYRKKLQLTEQQAAWLDKFWSPQNVFLAIPGGCVATIQLYLRALPALDEALRGRGTSLNQVVEQCQQESVRLSRGTGYWSQYDERYTREQAEANVYATLFRRCENVVREAYGHKRKLAAEFTGLAGNLGPQLEAQLGRELDALLPPLAATIAAPDAATEAELNVQNVTRWKGQFDQLAAGLNAATVPTVVAAIYQLGERNARNPSLENIFFEASRLLAKFDREEALRLYLHYVYQDLRSATVNSKPLAKTIQKSLFPQAEHLTRFEEIIAQLVRDRNLPAAVALVPTVYARARRRIELDRSAIAQAQHQHAGTVELLSGYLQDEPTTPPVAEATGPAAEPIEEIALQVPVAPPVSPAVAPVSGPLDSSWGLSPTQAELLALFAAAELRLPQTQVEEFARRHGVLRTQLLDGLNEQCYPGLDDVLVEEEGDDYTIYEAYYQKLTDPCWTI